MYNLSECKSDQTGSSVGDGGGGNNHGAVMPPSAAAAAAAAALMHPTAVPAAVGAAAMGQSAGSLSPPLPPGSSKKRKKKRRHRTIFTSYQGRRTLITDPVLKSAQFSEHFRVPNFRFDFYFETSDFGGEVANLRNKKNR